MEVFEYYVGKWGAFESKRLRTADLKHIWIFRWSDYSRIVSYYFTDLLGFCFKSGEFDDSALRRYYMKILIWWKPSTTFLSTE